MQSSHELHGLEVRGFQIVISFVLIPKQQSVNCTVSLLACCPYDKHEWDPVAFHDPSSVDAPDPSNEASLRPTRQMQSLWVPSFGGLCTTQYQLGQGTAANTKKFKLPCL